MCVIDIIIPYYRTDLYPQCVQSISELTEQESHQIYLVDDSRGRMGPIKAYNHGLRHTQNDVVLMNDDIVVTENWLTNMLSVDADVVLSLYHNETFYPNISCTLVRRAVVERVGFLDERWYLGFGADNQWFGRIERAGFRIGVNRKNRIYHIHRASIRSVPNYRQIAEQEQKMFLKLRQ
jgi:GT2 family glycosyltransferase